MRVFLLVIFLLVPSFLFASENLYKEKWCKDKRGKINQVVNSVTIDCITKDHAVDVSNLTSWEDLIGRAEVLRSAAPDKRPGVVVIYDKSKHLEYQQFKAVAEFKGVTVWSLNKDYLELKPQPKKKVIRMYEPKKKASQGRLYFTPKRKAVASSKPPTIKSPTVTKMPRGTITIITRTVVRDKIVQKESTPPPPRRKAYKPWLGNGFVDRLR
ncbi:hypothetical protein KAR91_66515 [Candidatus Pacearchaeota archaeon]|nr:hypothetical protein [Candidatus Pacearchaeota archaeon]